MLKKIVLVVCLFLFTGCDIVYNLDVLSFEENVVVSESNKNNYKYSSSALTMEEMKNYYLKKPLALDFSSMYSESMEKYEGVDYYIVNDISDDSKIGLNLIGDFDGDNSSSLLVLQGCKNYSVSKRGDEIVIEASDFKIFEQYYNLNKITINLYGKYGSSMDNADVVSNNIYTWIIDRSNYDTKEIKAKFNSSKQNKLFNDDMIIFSIALVFIFIFGFVIYLCTKKIFQRNNSM